MDTHDTITPLLEAERPSTANLQQARPSECRLADNSCFLTDGSNVPGRDQMQVQRKLVTACVLCFLFMLMEIVGGYFANSVAIMSDAAHMFSDMSAFAVSLFAAWAVTRKSDVSYSFGYHRAEIVGALVSIAIIWLVTGALVYEAILRTIHPVPVDGKLMFIVAITALVFNLALMLVVRQHHHHGGSCSLSHGEEHGHLHDYHHHHHSCGGHNHSHSHTHNTPSKQIQQARSHSIDFKMHTRSETSASLLSTNAPMGRSPELHSVQVDAGQVADCQHMRFHSLRDDGSSHKHEHGAHGVEDHSCLHEHHHAHADHKHGHDHTHAHGYNHDHAHDHHHHHLDDYESGRTRDHERNHPHDHDNNRHHPHNHDHDSVPTPDHNHKHDHGRTHSPHSHRNHPSYANGHSDCSHHHHTHTASSGGSLLATQTVPEEQLPEACQCAVFTFDGTGMAASKLSCECVEHGGDHDGCVRLGLQLAAELARKRQEQQRAAVCSSEGHLGLRSAFVHIVGDMIQSIGVALSGALIWWNKGDHRWYYADPICTYLFSIMVLLTTRVVMKDVIDTLMERTPMRYNLEAVSDKMSKVEGIHDVHDLHIWNLSMGLPILTAHVHISSDACPEDVLTTLEGYVHTLGISHSTIQICNIPAPSSPSTLAPGRNIGPNQE